ncbi:hypothetical protein SCUCBS95973_000698 [Sporothrix curviconia]|uniref:Maintenance of telomere capping protein 1 n=1 Tax=Sporothrix curviconia TaxID=1260050 RepID=A0ABP0ASK6_9PEZI
MATKRGKNTAATDELDSLFEGIGDNKAGASSSTAAAKKTTAAGKAGGKAGGKPKTAAAASSTAEKDILAELENELGEQVSRPHTPRTTAAKGSPALGASSTATLPRRSVESSKAYSARTSTDERAPAPVVESAPVETTPAPVASSSGGGGGGWWGGILSAATSTATAAMKQAEAAVKEIQSNEEAKKWANQVRGNYTSLRGFVGDEFRQRALPTFTDILHTLAPPIASHERLLIHITHDMVGYPSLDPLVHDMFLRVMAQVEGGDLLVVQRGQEAQPGHHGDGGNYGRDSAGWRDGPWWRAVDQPRDLGTVVGLREGTKLCRASAEAYANEYYAAHYGMSSEKGEGGARGDSKRGLEVARQRAVEPVSEENPVRRSDLFLAVQALSIAGGRGDDDDDDEDDDDDDEDDTDDKSSKEEEDDMVSFAVYIHDPVHEIAYHTVSQAIPAKWVRWLDARPASANANNTLTPATSGGEDESEDSSDEDSDEEVEKQKKQQQQKQQQQKKTEEGSLPDDIRVIVDSGGVDPREWAAEWIEETLCLAVGVVAQRYVAHRMGVGAGSIGRGKRPVDEVLADGAGEAARAGLL